MRLPFARSGLDRRLALGFGLMLVPLVVASAVSLGLLQSAGAAFTKASDDSAHDVGVTIRARNALQQTNDAPSNYVDKGDRGAIPVFREAAKRADAGFRVLATRGFDDARERALVRDATHSWRAARDHVFAVFSSSKHPASSDLDPFYEDVGGAEETLGKLIQVSLAERSEEQGAVVSRRNRQLLILFATLVVSCLLAAGVARWLRRSITRPLLELRGAAQRFGAGNLGYEVSLETGGSEFEQVADAFNEMASELRESQAQLAHQALHDGLTGLANRSLLYDRAEHALARGRRDDTRVSMLFLDLDDFKAINDSLGHAAGDKLLKDVTKRLSGAVREPDTVARLGGDEFAVLLEAADSEQASRTAERIQQVLEPPFRVGERDMRVRVSIGVASSDLKATDAEELLRNADIAMYAAKDEDRGGNRTFDPARHGEVVERVELEGDLRRAIEHDELEVHYQPILELGSGRVSGLEALARWTHPRRGAIPPDEFIPLAERSSLIVALGRWVLTRACRDMRQLERDRGGGAPLSMSVNVSAIELMEEDFVAFVARTLEESGLSPEALILEVTETVLVHDSEATLERLRQLKAVGVRLAVDDFGTGYSSLAYVEHLPLDVLKIDKTFVDPVGQSGEEADLVGFIVSLGRRLNLQTVAEGIEAAAQGQALERMGCELGQGFHYARPAPLETVRKLLADESSEPQPDTATAAA